MRAGQYLVRATEVMDVVTSHRSGATIMEVANKLELPKATAYRLVKSLVDVGYLTGGGRHGRYRLGPRFLRQYHNSIATKLVIDQVRPTLTQLAIDLDETTYLMTLVDREVRPICAEFPRLSSARLMIDHGELLPIHASSAGKVLAAYQDERLREQLIEEAEMDSYQPQTITDREQLRSELQLVRRQGYAVCDNEIDDGILAISVPIHLSGSGVIYSLGCNGMKNRLLEHQGFDKIVRLLKQRALELSGLLEGVKG